MLKSPPQTPDEDPQAAPPNPVAGAVNEFVARALQRPMPASLRPDNQVIYRDPPADIANVFGGRWWFLDREIKGVHRVGLLRGLGWTIPHQHRVPGVNSVRIMLHSMTGPERYTIEFGEVTTGSDPSSPALFESKDRMGPFDRSELKNTYAAYLGQHTI